MLKKNLILIMTIVILLVSAACSGLQLPGSSSTDTQENDPSQGLGDQPFEQRMAIGILQLEGTEQAITAEQARMMLPLWRAVKSLSTNETTTQDEIQAVYMQIQETMTADQVQVIKEMALGPEEMQAIMKELGIEAPQDNFGELTDEQRATMEAQRSAQGDGEFQFPGGAGGMPEGGGMPDGGRDMPEGGFRMPGGEMPDGGPSGMQSTTPMPGRQPGRMRAGFDSIFIESLIKLLEEKADS